MSFFNEEEWRVDAIQIESIWEVTRLCHFNERLELGEGDDDANWLACEDAGLVMHQSVASATLFLCSCIEVLHQHLYFCAHALKWSISTYNFFFMHQSDASASIVLCLCTEMVHRHLYLLVDASKCCIRKIIFNLMHQSGATLTQLRYKLYHEASSNRRRRYKLYHGPVQIRVYDTSCIIKLVLIGVDDTTCIMGRFKIESTIQVVSWSQFS